MSAQELRARARSIREQAQFADGSHDRELRAAAELERQAAAEERAQLTPEQIEAEQLERLTQARQARAAMQAQLDEIGKRFKAK